MVIGGKWLIRHLIVVVSLFIIAFPLGDKHHGLASTTRSWPHSGMSCSARSWWHWRC